MDDPLDPAARSQRMALVRCTGNRSTERRVEAVLLAAGIDGWVKHPRGIPGRPDFFFPRESLVLFVDGCFWHCCPTCRRHLPRNNVTFWSRKLDANRRRDNRVRRALRAQGYHVMRVWEHQLRGETWRNRLISMLRRHSSDEPRSLRSTRGASGERQNCVKRDRASGAVRSRPLSPGRSVAASSTWQATLRYDVPTDPPRQLMGGNQATPPAGA